MHVHETECCECARPHCCCACPAEFAHAAIEAMREVQEWLAVGPLGGPYAR